MTTTKQTTVKSLADIAPAAAPVANTPALNKEMIAAQERALRDKLLGTRETLISAAKVTYRQIARAEKSIDEAKLGFFWQMRDEGKQYKNVVHDFEKDIAPIIALAVAEAYASNPESTRKTYRHNAKVFFLAGVHNVDVDFVKLNEIVDGLKTELKVKGFITEEGKGKGGGRKPRPATAKAETTATSSTDTSSTATTDAVDPNVTTEPSIPAVVKPGKAYTVEVRRNAALILSGTPALSQDIVQACEVHRDQVLKFIRGLIESDKALKA